jgi:hypothetical protein
MAKPKTPQVVEESTVPAPTDSVAPAAETAVDVEAVVDQEATAEVQFSTDPELATPPVVEPIKSGPMVKARVLVGCSFGRCDDVVEMEASQAEALVGVVDTDPAAVEYAESLTK